MTRLLELDPAETKNELLALDPTGDTRLLWDPDVTDEVAAARKMFDDLKKKRYTAFRVKGDGGKGELIRDFDPHASKMIMTPPLAGG